MSSHFEGKDVYEHLKSARQKGAKATSEVHGAEAPGSWIAAADCAKETSIVLLSFWIILSTFNLDAAWSIFITFSCGWLIWKVGRSSLLGWNRLERLHRLIEEERWEIQHHRAQEKEELRAMYEQKGFSGALLDQAVEVMMADDNRLLKLMLEEELGLTLESYEHPLKQAVGAGIGTLIAIICAIIGLKIGGFWAITSSLFVVFAGATLLMTKKEGNQSIKSLIWNLSVGIVAIATVHFIAKWIA